MVRYLLENGADPTIKDKTGRDALEIAKHLKRDGVVKIRQEYRQKLQNEPPKVTEMIMPAIKTIQSQTLFNFIEINFTDEFIQCSDGKAYLHHVVYTLCPSLKQHSALGYNIVLCSNI
jgi:ankyrin repeat protein